MNCVVTSQTALSPQILDLRVKLPEKREILPGQFMLLYPEDGARLLPRPISVCEVLEEGKEQLVRMVYRIAGEGTKEFSRLTSGDALRMEGPRGNGFPLRPKEFSGKMPEVPLLIGGGIGLPPLVELSKQLAVRGAKPVAAAGYRDGNLFLAEDLARYAEVFPACEELTEQTTEKHREDNRAEEAASVKERIRKPRKGNVLEVIRREELKADVIYACGPMPMLKAVKELALERKIPAYVSLEERMACGMGVCLGCVAKTKDVDAHSGVRNARVCVEGPVFEAAMLDL